MYRLTLKNWIDSIHFHLVKSVRVYPYKTVLSESGYTSELDYSTSFREYVSTIALMWIVQSI